MLLPYFLFELSLNYCSFKKKPLAFYKFYTLLDIFIIFCEIVYHVKMIYHNQRCFSPCLLLEVSPWNKFSCIHHNFNSVYDNLIILVTFIYQVGTSCLMQEDLPSFALLTF